MLGRFRLICILTASAAMLVACETPKKSWTNDALFEKVRAGKISKKQLSDTYDADKAQCKEESSAVSVPKLKCKKSTHREDCAAYPKGIAKDLCVSNNRTKCNTAEHHAASKKRDDIALACMNQRGWQLKAQ